MYWTSVNKGFTVAAKTGVNSVKYKMAFWNAKWAFTIDQCIYRLFFLSLYFEGNFEFRVPYSQRYGT